jgi:hypothetical protein
MQEYSLTCINNSELHGSFALYQVPPQVRGPTGPASLVWLARPAAPGTHVRFSWSTEIGFIWGERGTFRGQTTFTAYQYVAADPDRENVIDLTSDNFGAPTFQNLRIGGPQGTMTVRQLSVTFDFPVHLGVALGKSPIYTVDFNANVLSTFIPHRDRCWVAFGSYTAGEALDVGALTNVQVVDFSSTSPSQEVILTPQNILRKATARNVSRPFA